MFEFIVKILERLSKKYAAWKIIRHIETKKPKIVQELLSDLPKGTLAKKYKCSGKLSQK